MSLIRTRLIICLTGLSISGCASSTDDLTVNQTASSLTGGLGQTNVSIYGESGTTTGLPKYANVETQNTNNWITAGSTTSDGAWGVAAPGKYRLNAGQEIFYLGTNGDVLHRYTSETACAFGGCWTSYGSDNWGQPSASGFSTFGQVAAGNDLPTNGNSVDVFAMTRCTNPSGCGFLTNAFQIERRHFNGTSLGPWTFVAVFAKDETNFAFDGLHVASTGANEWDLFRVDVDNTFLHYWSTNDGATWSSEKWTYPATIAFVEQPNFAAASYVSNSVDVFFSGPPSTGGPYHLYNAYKPAGGSVIFRDWGAIPCTSTHGPVSVQSVGAVSLTGNGTSDNAVAAAVECKVPDSASTEHFEVWVLKYDLQLNQFSSWLSAGTLPGVNGGGPSNRISLSSVPVQQ